MLFAFILFGAVLSTLVGDRAARARRSPWRRSRSSSPGPRRSRSCCATRAISRSARAFIAWFGPRGLASLLLALLVVQARLPGAEAILAIAGVVVTVSVVLHGVSATPLTAAYAAEGRAGDARRGAGSAARASCCCSGAIRLGRAADRWRSKTCSPGCASDRPAAHSRRALALELREGSGRDSGRRARAARRGRELGGQAAPAIRRSSPTAPDPPKPPAPVWRRRCGRWDSRRGP